VCGRRPVHPDGAREAKNCGGIESGGQFADAYAETDVSLGAGPAAFIVDRDGHSPGRTHNHHE